MSVARHNPRDSDGRAQALMWDDRLKEDEKYSTTSKIQRFQHYHAHYARAFKLQQGLLTNQGVVEEIKALREKRLANMRLSGPKDGLKGTFRDESISGDPWWYKKMLKEDGKLPIGPRTDFQPADFLIELEQTTKLMNSLDNSSKLDLPVHLPRSYLQNQHISSLQQQYVDSHLLYVNLLEIQKDIVLTPEHRERIANALQREFQYISQNPTAKQKDLSDLLTNYQKLGQPSDEHEQIACQHFQNENAQFNAQVSAMDAHDKTLILATKDKLNKLRGNIGIQQQIQVALEFSKSAIERAVSLQINPEFHDLNPTERQEYLNYLKEDLMIEQERLDRDMKLTVGEIEQLRKYDRIQLLPQSKIPYLPMPSFAQSSLHTLNSVPYLINDNPLATDHQYLFDSKNIFNECIPSAIEYMQCMRKHQWANKLEDVLECTRHSTKLFSCQRDHTTRVQLNNTESWGQMITRWLWGDEDGKTQTTSQFNGTASANTGIDLSILELSHISPTRAQKNDFEQRNQQSLTHRTALLQDHVISSRSQFDQSLRENNLYYTPEQLSANGDNPLVYEGTPTQLPNQHKILPTPTHSPLTGTPIDPASAYHYQNSQRRELQRQREMFDKFGPVDDVQVSTHHMQTYHDDYEQLAPGYRRYHPYQHDSKKYHSNSYLFNTDHQYRLFDDPEDVKQQVDKDWEHLEQYGTSTGETFNLRREDPDPINKRWIDNDVETLWWLRFEDQELDTFHHTMDSHKSQYEDQINRKSRPTHQSTWF